MGFSVQKIEYMDGSGVQSGSRAFGHTGSHNYWTRITIRTDELGCSSLSAYVKANCYNGATPPQKLYYAAGIRVDVSASNMPSGSSPDRYYQGPANMAAAQQGDTTTWAFSGTISVSLAANTTYYVFLRMIASNADTFAQSITSGPTITSQANWQNYSLSISAGQGSSVSVYRSASSAGAAIGNVAAGSPIFNGDTLTITFSTEAGYVIAAHTVNGTTYTSGASMTVSGNVNVVATATRIAYTLTFTADSGSTVTVRRNNVVLSSGDTIYYGDTLTVVALPNAGYELDTATINGVAFVSPKSVNVTGNVAVVVTSSALGFAYIRKSGAWTPYLIYIRVSAAWARYRAYLWKSGAWTAY